jgi:uncharacterized protein YqjF (DUF2071 family)
MSERAWLMTQTWHDLLFAHWQVDPGLLASKIPPDFELDMYDGTAWVGVVPFRMTNVAPRYVPALPWVSAFPELNVRTYVRTGGKPGVYFFSLDAGNPVAVQTARALLNLPYYSASMIVEDRGTSVHYSSRRNGPPSPGFGAALLVAELVAEYEPTGPSFQPAEGSLEYFLTERYCLYALDRRARPYRLEIHHPPWPLQVADARFERKTVAEASGITLPGEKPVLHFARRQDMVAWGRTKLNGEC